MPRPRNRLRAALGAIHKKSPKAVRRSDVTAFPSRWRIPSGSFDLDHRSGGGLRVGGVTCYWGKKSGGKTTTALRHVANAQNMCRNCWRPAHADRWVTLRGLIQRPTDEQVIEIVQSAETQITRREAHDSFVGEGYEMVPHEPGAGPFGPSCQLYVKGDEGVDETFALAVRIEGAVENVEPEEEFDAEGNPTRWSARGWCDCFVTWNSDGEKHYDPEQPDRDALIEWGFLETKPPLNSKAHKQAIADWLLEMTLNSYDEVICNWVDMEGSLDLNWASKIGVDTRRLLLTLPDSAEDAIDIIAALLSTAEVDFQVLDSIAQLAPEAELEGSARDWQQGLMARLLNKAIRRWNQSMLSARRHEYRPLTQLWINQERLKIGVMFGSPSTMPGGLGQGFQVVDEVKWSHGKTEKATEKYGAEHEVIEVPVWEELRFEVTKSKGGGMRSTKGNYRQSMRDTDAYPAGTILDYERIFKLAMDRLVEQKKKGSKKIYVLGDREYTSQSAISNNLREDPQLYVQVRETLMNTLLTG